MSHVLLRADFHMSFRCCFASGMKVMFKLPAVPGFFLSLPGSRVNCHRPQDTRVLGSSLHGSVGVRRVPAEGRSHLSLREAFWERRALSLGLNSQDYPQASPMSARNEGGSKNNTYTGTLTPLFCLPLPHLRTLMIVAVSPR